MFLSAPSRGSWRRPTLLHVRAVPNNRNFCFTNPFHRKHEKRRHRNILNRVSVRLWGVCSVEVGSRCGSGAGLSGTSQGTASGPTARPLRRAASLRFNFKHSPSPVSVGATSPPSPCCLLRLHRAPPHLPRCLSDGRVTNSSEEQPEKKKGGWKKVTERKRPWNQPYLGSGPQPDKEPKGIINFFK